MKKVVGKFGNAVVGTYEFEFFVKDEATKEEIETRLKEAIKPTLNYTVINGYQDVRTIKVHKCD